MAVEIVSVETEDGLRLDGSLRQPDASRSSSLNFDAAILVHGLGGNFYAPSFFRRLEVELATRGCAALRANTRGHDLMYSSPRGRLGAAYEIVDDCRKDLRAWLDFAESQGYRRLLLWGHSLGAVKAIYYLAREKDGRVPRVVASSPPRLSYRTNLQMQGAERLLTFIEEAKRLVDAGKPRELVAVDIPSPTLYSAEAFLDKYYPDDRYNFLDRLPELPVPALVTIGSLEGAGPEQSDWFPFGNLAAQVTERLRSVPDATFQLIDGANHAYSGKSDELWQTALAWLEKAPIAAR
jgi:pimeloyl-ACP methyl ester carboxylesterase